MSLVRFIKHRGMNRCRDLGVIPEIPYGHSVPRIIHQTYPTANLPKVLQDNADCLRQKNPDWEYRFYSDEDIDKYIGAHFPQLLSFYHSITLGYGAAKADFFRYLVIYREGGVYLDIKSVAERALVDVIDHYSNAILLSHWAHEYKRVGPHRELPEAGEIQQWFIVAPQGHPALKAVLENMLDNMQRYIPALHGTGWDAVLRVTGPVGYTLAINKCDQGARNWVDSELDLGFLYSCYRALSPKPVSETDMYLLHRKDFPSHYSQQKTALIEQGFVRKLINVSLIPVAFLLKTVVRLSCR